MKLITLIQLAALAHVVLISAGLTMPKAIGLTQQLATLAPFPRRLFWVYYTFIGFIIVSFGLLTWFFSKEMAAGDPVASALATLMAGFWILRLIVAAFVLDEKPYLTTPFYKVGNLALHGVFLFLTALYTYVAWKGLFL